MHLQKANLKIKLSKCKFLQDHLHQLGHLKSEHGIQMLLEKESVIEKLKEPSNIDELHHFLGLLGYCRKFISLFTNVTQPLDKLLKKDTKFQWLPQYQEAFEHLKSTLQGTYTSAP